MQSQVDLEVPTWVEVEVEDGKCDKISFLKKYI